MTANLKYCTTSMGKNWGCYSKKPNLPSNHKSDEKKGDQSIANLLINWINPFNATKIVSLIYDFLASLWTDIIKKDWSSLTW